MAISGMDAPPCAYRLFAQYLMVGSLKPRGHLNARFCV
jgi:hypothetical protein